MRLAQTLDLHPPAAVREIARRLEEAGFETWAVGGAVRDAALGRPAGDWDLATLARPQEVRRLFRRTVPIGIEHGTVGVLARDGLLYEVTTFRRDIETFGRHAVVEFADSIEEDLARRDFTLNALAWHPLTGELRDPFGGWGDLRSRLLRTVGDPADRFAEDYLRVLRALRFAGHFLLEIEPATWGALTAATPQLERLSAERVREELWKILTKTRRASAALSLYAAAGVLPLLYAELEALVGLDPDAGHAHDAWTESVLAVDAVSPARPLVRMAALLHALGKPVARTRDLRGGWRFTGHEALGGRLAEQLLRRLKASNADTDRVSRLVRQQSDLFPPDAPPAGIRRWLLHVPPELVNDLFRLRFGLWRANAAHAGRRPDDLLERWRKARGVLQQHPPLTLSELALGGQDLKALGLEPGPQFREILQALLERVVEKPELNTREALLELVRQEWPLS
ncbi:MAG: HD domain-containing protein [Gemmatimonadetes bacterium]|nr:HD domain-containing protein [Gemmatimonadota bacterium]